ncbi:MAG: hypothetical protein KI792_10500 [Alphaproteobacteria bacterium]|nr:hypothetical protein [Alphaproteobacteria bacterium SS10]
MIHIDTDRLLELARLTLLEKVLNKPPAINRYPTLMAANALAIVRRYQAQYPAVRRAQAALYGEWAAAAALPIPRSDQGGPPDATLLAANVADAIRRGRFDHHPGITDQFRELLAAELAITNPAFLEQFEPDEADDDNSSSTDA